ncbi:bifunctional 2-C-methyl-D-erythritol 4-phosphate cytidylyltransferase/2-C-methyl-D-erythritol 2,4-cyclodiphosphate synthase [Parasphingorhabdus sp.]|uniref:bifunctional 2-C-methyl-D-erythritol 4-phosphate cytidylyltransferase/2-C-methyl-D-erythritol 2,4-cyclodiphosphate synthase n=1 Tax=Parasphingorhabdus sp. TaxID=2709688 RepID=UPI003BAEF8F3
MTDSNPQIVRNDVIIVAAGQGERSGLRLPKQYALLKGRPMVRYSAKTFLEHPKISKLWVVIQPGHELLLKNALDGLKDYEVVMGGATRQESVRKGLSAVATSGDVTNILIHDAARPFLSFQMIDRLLASLTRVEGAIPVLPTTDTMISVTDGYAEQTLDRDALWRVQTPQAFNFKKLTQAHKQWNADNRATDDGQIFKAAGNRIAIVEGDEALKKYTTANDFKDTSERYEMVTRSGIGFDVHQLVAGEELWLGGLRIDHDRGLAGHSDADVLLHALTDALLGAAGAGDIGDHFPPSDPQWRNASSDKFVKFAVSVINEKGGHINNVDMTVICEAPKIKPYREAMRKNIAEMLDLSIDRVSVKATTTERLGFTGRGEGIAAQAVATTVME